MLAHVHQIVGKLLIVLRLQVVLATVGITAHATAVGHVVRTRIAKGLEHRIRSLLTNLQHDLALSLVAVPVVVVAREVLEALHLCAQALAIAHVVRRAVLVLRVVAAAYVIAEVLVVQSRGTRQPSHNLVNLLVGPLATLAGPPAERHAPSLELLSHQRGEHHIRERVDGYGAIHLLAEEPEVLHVGAVLVGEHLAAGIVAVGTQVLAVALAANADVCPLGLLEREPRIVGGRVGDERCVPCVQLRQIAVALLADVVVAIAVGHNRHPLRAHHLRRLQLSAIVARHPQMVATAVHHEQRRRSRKVLL